MTTYIDKVNNFIESFNPKTGFYFRSGVIQNGADTGVDPFMRDFPQLIDIGIMGQCAHGSEGLCNKAGIQCYQNGDNVIRNNMSVKDYVSIIQQCSGKVFQVALGGRGDVDQHEHLQQILSITRDHGIVPNFTTSGYNFTRKIADMCNEYVGAIAVSWYRAPHTIKAIDTLLTVGIKTNIHYVLGKNSIDEAIYLLKNNLLPHEINAIIFYYINR